MQTLVYTVLFYGGLWLAFRIMGHLAGWIAENCDGGLRRKETARVMAFRSTLRAVDLGLIRLPRVY